MICEDTLKEKIDGSLENDDPSILDSIIDDVVEDCDDQVPVMEFMSECTDFLSDLIDEVYKQKKAKLFLYLKDKFPDTYCWEKQLELIKAEHHQIVVYMAGTMEDVDITKIYTVNDEGEMVIDEDKLQDVIWDHDCDFDTIGEYCWTAQKGGYDIDYYSTKHKDIKWILKKAGLFEEAKQYFSELDDETEE